MVCALMVKHMMNTNRLLLVPQDVDLRKLLRREAARLLQLKGLVPPLSFNQIEGLARELLALLGVKEDFLDFTIVVCGNVAWQKVVAATPFNRRLLLLPQCLKDSKQCRAEIDDLGLICAGCRSCPIDRVLSRAEALGYTTLVAEGTTVAVGLVEEGAVDAVIGVSCMSVLQRSFEPVSRSAVPVIGIPLLREGCVDTLVDEDWLFEEIGQWAPDPSVQPLSVSLLKVEVQDVFSDLSLSHFFPGRNETDRLAKLMMEIGGQRLRPLLAVLAYQAYAPSVNNKLQVALALIVECFHKASLIHDDIEDGDDFRYNRQTLHRSHGVPVAINVGDYLIGKGYQLLAALPVPPQVLAQLLGVVASSHVNLSAGQGDDLLFDGLKGTASVGRLLQIFAQKTGEAVKVALATGAIAGGAGSSELEVLSAFSDCFGMAYQIRDDLNEFRNNSRPEHVHHFPFLMALLTEKLIQTKRDVVLDLLASMPMEELYQFIRDEQIDCLAESSLNGFVRQCRQHLDRLQNLKLKLSLYGLMGKIFD